ncbi:TetR/AcrR family transcriptional regulator [Kurthia gibsonii]|uniref:TetR/AcrR family transcriptional regulator n=1 Tax=Kurthia gibsonii TaxID=33946 RepID=UPI0030D128FC
MSVSPKNLGRPKQEDRVIPTKTHILNTAIQLFLQYSYKNTAMDEVALKCNVTKATVYYYFKTKAELFTAAVESLMTTVRQSSVKILSQHIPFQERLEQLIIVFTRATVDIDIHTFIREASSSLSEDQLKRIQASEDAMHDAIEACFAKEVENGVLPNKSTKFMAHLFLSLLNLSKFTDSNGQGFFNSLEETAHEITTFFWNGVHSSK